MKSVAHALVLSLLSCCATLVADAITPRQVRPLDPWASESLARGLRRSAIVRQLVAILDRSDVIVHLQTTVTLPSGTAGTTRLGGNAGGYRYIRIHLDRSLLPDERAAILAHELQHAVELAESNVRDDEGLRSLFERIGHRPAHRLSFDTTAAQQAGTRAWAELRGGRWGQ